MVAKSYGGKQCVDRVCVCREESPQEKQHARQAVPAEVQDAKASAHGGGQQLQQQRHQPGDTLSLCAEGALQP